jgi:DHA1 family tetracycline resistance protein-like MFS transporter
MILLGLALCIGGYALFGLAPGVWLFVLGIPFLCLGGLAGPPAQAMVTHLVDPHEQGRLQGALTSLASLAGIFGPALFANLFALFISDHAPVRHLPGAAFLLAALLLAAATLVAVRATRGAAPSHAGAVPALPGEASPLAMPVADPLPDEPPEQSP